MLVFMDIDGVIADCSHRLKYLENKNYDKFYSEEMMMEDQPIQIGLDLLGMFLGNWEVELYLLTGRPYRTEEITKKWLKQYLSEFDCPPILMRRDHDYRKSEVVKTEIVDKSLHNKNSVCYGADEILFIDDDPKNVKAVEEACGKVKGIVFGATRL